MIKLLFCFAHSSLLLFLREWHTIERTRAFFWDVCVRKLLGLKGL